jgi:hypothetical protein
MPLKNFLPVLSLCSLVLGLLLFALAFVFVPPQTEAGPVESWVSSGPLFAVLELDVSIPDRETALALKQALGQSIGGAVLSESSQWALLDDFGEILLVPLDQYGERVEPFDPRNDGYAERLRSFFVLDGKRYFFIPLGDSPRFGAAFQRSAYRHLELTIREFMGETPYALIFPGEGSLRTINRGAGRGTQNGSYRLHIVFYLLASAAACFLFRPRLLACLLVLPLAGLSLSGSSGFALGAILCLLAGLLLEPARELCFSIRCGGSFRRRGEGRFASMRRNSLIPYRFRWLLAFPLAGLYVLSAILGNLAPPLALGTFVVFWGIFFAYFLIEAGGKGGHVPFVPVMIMGGRMDPLFPKVMLPFASASLVSLLISLFALSFGAPEAGTVPLERGPEGGGAWPPPISAAEYEAHVRFQTGFSFSPLGSGFAQSGYFHYDMDQDGLIADVSAEAYGVDGDIPPFSLEGLMIFLENQVYMQADISGGGVFSLIGCLPALFSLLICLPMFTGPVRRGGGRRKPLLYNDKRIAA